MRTETLSKKVGRLEREIEALGQETSEEKQQQWRFKRGDLAQAQYELFLELETQRPILGVQLLYKSATIGNFKARDRLFTKKSQSESIVKEDEQDQSKLSAELSFVYGLQALAGVGIKPDDSSAFQYFQFAAEKGYLEAQTFLGWMYEGGRGVAQDDAQAVAWYRRAAEQGYAVAQANFGWMYIKGRGVAQDDAQAVGWFRRAAEQGNAVAQKDLGWMYDEGRGVAQDDAQAVAWYRRAAERGNAVAQNNLGLMYQEGRGVAQDDVQAMAWIRRGAEQGNAVAQNNLGWMYQEGRGLARDDVQAVTWYCRAAEQGHAMAQNSLGVMYREGRGVAQDDVQAMAWIRRAAEQGNAAAQNNLGWMYEEGRGVAQDDAQAVAWYRRAGEQGDALAQNSLSWMYQEGRGVVQDDVEAAAWCRRAAEQRLPVAQTTLGGMYREGRGVALDDAQAVEWYRRAAEQGFAVAQANLGVMYQEGRGVARDDAQAVEWYRRAAEQRDEVAQKNLGWMYQEGRGLPQDYVQAVAWYRRSAEQGYEPGRNNLGWMYEHLINPNPDEAIDYRKDYQLGIKPALVMLEQCSRVSSSAKYHYQQALGNNSGIQEILKKEPNEFFEGLMTDTLLSQEARDNWLKLLFEEQHRQINQSENASTDNKRTKLKPDYLMTLNMEVAKKRYAVLATSQLPNKREETNMREVEEIKWLANKLESQKSKIEELIKILNTITEDHPAYPEAQLILSHLHFRLDQEGSQWKQHFAKCEEVDKENKWIGLQIIPNWIHFQKSCEIIQEYLKALLSKDESKIENLLKQELLEVAQDRYAIEPLLRLSIMAKNPEKFESCVSSLKALGLDEEEIEEKAQSILSNKSYV